MQRKAQLISPETGEEVPEEQAPEWLVKLSDWPLKLAVMIPVIFLLERFVV